MTETNAPRFAALDVFRGLAVAGMIVVTSPGDWNRTYWPLQHAQWNGWTPTDMVFPVFLFGVGMALGLSFPRRLDTSEARGQFWLRVGRRAIALILLGLFLNWMYVISVEVGVPPAGPDLHPGLRIPGVLQRIALCYAMAAVLIVATARKDDRGYACLNARAIAVAIVAILAVYWALLSFVPVPGYGAGHLDQAGSLPAYIDRMIFTPRHMWPLGAKEWRHAVTYDPEGLLSSLPATVNVLFGVLAAYEWRRSADRAIARIAIAGAALMILAIALDPFFPINKRLWTSSFALLSSGVSCLTLVAVVLILRSDAVRKILIPLDVLGGNAILAFSISIVLGSFAGMPLNGAHGPTSPQGWGDAIALQFIPDAYLASLACALAILALITLAIWPLHRRGIYLRL